MGEYGSLKWTSILRQRRLVSTALIFNVTISFLPLMQKHKVSIVESNTNLSTGSLKVHVSDSLWHHTSRFRSEHFGSEFQERWVRRESSAGFNSTSVKFRFSAVYQERWEAWDDMETEAELWTSSDVLVSSVKRWSLGPVVSDSPHIFPAGQSMVRSSPCSFQWEHDEENSRDENLQQILQLNAGNDVMHVNWTQIYKTHEGAADFMFRTNRPAVKTSYVIQQQTDWRSDGSVSPPAAAQTANKKMENLRENSGNGPEGAELFGSGSTRI